MDKSFKSLHKCTYKCTFFFVSCFMDVTSGSASSPSLSLHLVWQRKTAPALLIGLSVGVNSSQRGLTGSQGKTGWLMDQANPLEWMLCLWCANTKAWIIRTRQRCQVYALALLRKTLHKNSNLGWPTTLDLSKHGVSLGFRSWGHNNISGFSQQNQSHDAPTLPYSFFLFNREWENKADCLEGALYETECSSRNRAHVHLYKSNLHFSKRLKTFHHLALALDASASPDTQPVPCVIIQPPKISNLPQNSFQPVTTKKEVPTENKRQHSQQSVLDDFF